MSEHKIIGAAGEAIEQPTLRDLAAFAALTGIIQPMFTSNGCSSVNSGCMQHAIAAYALADAMLEARKK